MKKMRYASLLIISLLAGNAFVFANTNPADTLLIKAGDYKMLDSGIEGIDALMGNTGNQDIAVPEADDLAYTWANFNIRFFS